MEAFTEPRVYGLSRNRLTYSIAAFIAVAVMSFLDIRKVSVGWLIFLILLAIFLFIPFLYKLVVSNEAISSINLFRTETLAWNEVIEIKPKNNGLLLLNADNSIKVFVSPQIDEYPDVIKLIQQKLSYLWHSNETAEFHQGIVETIIQLFMGIGLLLFVAFWIFSKGLASDVIIPAIVTLIASTFFIWNGLTKIRKLSLQDDFLVVDYVFWQRQLHVKEVESVYLEQEMGKNQISYPVYIRLQDGKQIVLKKVREGNPVLLSALEQWLQKYQKSV